MADSGPLDGVVVFLHACHQAGPVDPKLTLKRKLESLGARLCQRLARDTTHVVFQRQHHASDLDIESEAILLQDLQERASKVAGNVFFVSPLWVDRCAQEQRRAIERQFEIRQLPQKLLLRRRSSTPGSGSGKKAKVKRILQPTPADAFVVDTADAVYSSSQQIRAGPCQGGELDMEANSPAQGKQGRKLTRSTAHLLQSEVDLSTQLAADILVSDLAGGPPAEHRRASRTRRPATSDQPAKRPRRSQHSSAGGLAALQASMHHLQCADLASPPPKAGATRRRSLRSRTSTAAPDTDDASAALGSEGDRIAPSEPPAEIDAGAAASKQAASTLVSRAVLNGGRFSVRQMAKQQETGLPIMRDHEAAPTPSGEPDATRMQELCVPSFTRVNSPWPSESGISTPGATVTVGVLAAPRIFTSQPGRRQTRAAAAATQAAPAPAGQAATAQRRSRMSNLGTPAAGLVTPDVEPAAKQVLPPQPQWSAPRVWDPSHSAGGQRASLLSVENADPNAMTSPPAITTARCSGAVKGVLALSSEDAEVIVAEAITACAAAAPVTTEAAHKAVQQMRSMRMCSDGCEENVTHLILGAERRTIKVLLAIANGAWILKPEWITESLDNGAWLPEEHYQCQSRFTAAAARARAQQLSRTRRPAAGKLLCSERLHVHEPHRKGITANGPHLRRLAAALDAKVVPLQSCTVCIVAGGVAKPATLPAHARAVTEEWLLHTAEQYLLPGDESSWQIM